MNCIIMDFFRSYVLSYNLLSVQDNGSQKFCSHPTENVNMSVIFILPYEENAFFNYHTPNRIPFECIAVNY
jgi:hypothetical protein